MLVSDETDQKFTGIGLKYNAPTMKYILSNILCWAFTSENKTATWLSNLYEDKQFLLINSIYIRQYVISSLQTLTNMTKIGT